MRIAQIAPLFESVPPRLYGGTERVVSYLTEELVRQGHRVTLFASGDSITSAELVPCIPRALRLDPGVRDPLPHHMVMLDKVAERASEFDVLHFHIDYLHFPLFRFERGRALTTLHGRQDLADHMPFYRRFSDMPLVSISNAQRTPLSGANFVATVHHGLPLDLLTPNFQPRGGYLAFLGRISPEKRPDRAIAIARQAGLPLKIAAKVDKADEAYFRDVVAPMLKGPGIEFVGEICENAKSEFLGQAAGLLFPIDWPEPFGLVMIEAMACGTPVLAFRCGSVPEIVEEGVTGCIVSDVDRAVRAIPNLMALDRRTIRSRFEEHFSSARMAASYMRVYQKILRRHPAPDRQLSTLAARSAATNGHGVEARSRGSA
ncbi:MULTISPECIES: glycosyltransferase family 4 protein [Bradyrhizobium]|uniref:glycosyltransferase family 4 protein n=1 Tax=Bradyrhizobium TaxID=374 RepID=UPI000231C3F2|nr:glycosyltransferase family 4 protein [Bradyrhizobium japonicum]MCS3534413.1 glycosyltransferase involved in cell wall biosynthesis [Bradyrhizobium japonicum]MCS3989491.1 glycosyltransferase involved in cell wall biosynthesis [Bradyrhizobium japonicum]MCS4015693.1 glycosyltransferase involved in cell wall biosynthesis [Bradyrhizobium japonicum]MCS4202789.1 glycosyltransferase involved in cell wall biosynthesis [Bradyrhizobium japonicum]MDH6175561.1 glycosyltransferase involved in cell wall b